MKKSCFFELVEYQKSFFKENIKIQLLTGYFYTTTEYLFLMNVENDIYNIVNEGKDIIRNLYNSNQEKFEVYIFIFVFCKEKEKMDKKKKRIFRKN